MSSTLVDSTGCNMPDTGRRVELQLPLPLLLGAPQLSIASPHRHTLAVGVEEFDSEWEEECY